VGALDPAPHGLDLGRVGGGVEAPGGVERAEGVEPPLQGGGRQDPGVVGQIGGDGRGGRGQRFEAARGTPGGEVTEIGLVGAPGVRCSGGLGVLAHPLDEIGGLEGSCRRLDEVDFWSPLPPILTHDKRTLSAVRGDNRGGASGADMRVLHWHFHSGTVSRV
jgi:hypothetical protein